MQLRGRLACLAVVPLLLGACGGSDSDPPEAQPTPDGATFGAGTFDALPRYPRSSPVSDRHEEDGVVAQSFRAEGATAEQVLDWYAGRLDGWNVAEPPGQIGQGTYRGRWTRGDRSLVVSATEAPAFPQDQAGGRPAVQYSLSLEPLHGSAPS